MKLKCFLNWGTLAVFMASLVVQWVKNPLVNAGDADSIPGLGRSPEKAVAQEVSDFKKHEDFPGSTACRNLPGNPGDHRFNPLSRKILHAVEQLSPRTTTTEPSSRALKPQLLSLCA